jgi:hypothetical protein
MYILLKIDVKKFFYFIQNLIPDKLYGITDQISKEKFFESKKVGEKNTEKVIPLKIECCICLIFDSSVKRQFLFELNH